MADTKFNIFTLYFFRLKLRFLLKKLGNPADCPYLPPQRYVEFTWVENIIRQNLRNNPLLLLEIGCGTGFLLSFLASRHNIKASGVDMDTSLKSADIFAQALKLNTPERNKASTVSADGCHLPFSDNSFDWTVSVSALEHFADKKDSIAMKEIQRVLKPGGMAAITLPISNAYEETFKDEDVYSEKYKGKPVFFERWYDEKALADRILTPAHFIVKEKQIFAADQKKPSVISSLVKYSPFPGMEAIARALQWKEIASPVKHRFGDGPVVCLVLQK